MKKLLIILSFIFLIGCSNKNASNFKKDYESLNGKTNSYGKKYREVTINKKNPFIEVEASEIVKKIENKETFYVYFGSRLCPWCRSVIEKSIEVSNKNNIKKIYYVDIWDDDGNEILRDKYKIEDNKLILEKEGTKEYKKLLKYFDKFLRNYEITNDDKTYDTKEKRIYAPNFMYIKKGKIVKLTTGKSSKQTDPYQKLTKEMLKEEEKEFNKFFTN